MVGHFQIQSSTPLLWFFREGDSGSRITLVGLGVNVILTSAKGAAGWFMNSAALLADAGHSLSGKHVRQLDIYCTSPSSRCALQAWSFVSWRVPVALLRCHPSA